MEYKRRKHSAKKKSKLQAAEVEDSQQDFLPVVTSTQSLSLAQFDSIKFDPRATSTQHVDHGWARKMSEEEHLGYPSQDYIVKGPLSFKSIQNIYTGKQVKVLVEPITHDGFVTKQQVEAHKNSLLHGSTVRLVIEGNIGSGTADDNLWL